MYYRNRNITITIAKPQQNTFHTRLVKMKNIKFCKELANALNLGFEYAIEKNPKQHINTLII
jgi:hypothetical protein